MPGILRLQVPDLPGGDPGQRVVEGMRRGDARRRANREEARRDRQETRLGSPAAVDLSDRDAFAAIVQGMGGDPEVARKLNPKYRHHMMSALEHQRDDQNRDVILGHVDATMARWKLGLQSNGIELLPNEQAQVEAILQDLPGKTTYREAAELAKSMDTLQRAVGTRITAEKDYADAIGRAEAFLGALSQQAAGDQELMERIGNAQTELVVAGGFRQAKPADVMKRVLEALTAPGKYGESVGAELGRMLPQAAPAMQPPEPAPAPQRDERRARMAGRLRELMGSERPKSEEEAQERLERAAKQMGLSMEGAARLLRGGR